MWGETTHRSCKKPRSTTSWKIARRKKGGMVQEGVKIREVYVEAICHQPPSRKQIAVLNPMTCRQIGTRTHGLKVREAGAAQAARMLGRLF